MRKKSQSERRNRVEEGSWKRNYESVTREEERGREWEKERNKRLLKEKEREEEGKGERERRQNEKNLEQIEKHWLSLDRLAE